MIYGEKFLNVRNESMISFADIQTIIEFDFDNVDNTFGDLINLQENNAIADGIKNAIKKIADTFIKFIGWLGNIIGKVFPKIKQFLNKFQDAVIKKADKPIMIPSLSFYHLDEKELRNVLEKIARLNSDFNKINIVNDSRDNSIVNKIDKYKEENDKFIESLSDELLDATVNKENSKYFVEEKIDNIIVNDKSSNYKELEQKLLNSIKSDQDAAEKVKELINHELSNIRTINEFLNKDGWKLDSVIRKYIVTYVAEYKQLVSLDRRIIALIQTNTYQYMITLKKLYNPTKDIIDLVIDFDDAQKLVNMEA